MEGFNQGSTVSPLSHLPSLACDVSLTLGRVALDAKIEEVRDKITKLEEYKVQYDGLTAIHTAHETAIAQARRWCDQHTKSDIVKIRREYYPQFTLSLCWGRQ